MPDDFGAPPILALQQTGGPAPLVVNGDNWILDLGQVEAGSLLQTLRFGVLNAAQPPADALTVRFDVATDPDIRVYAPSSYDDLAPGTGQGEVDAIIGTSTPGVHEATITLHEEQVAADGSLQPLPDRLVTIHEDVVGTLDAAAIPADGFSSGLPPDHLLSTPVSLGGQDFARIQNLGSWTGSGTLDFAPDHAAADSYGNAYLLATFETVHANFGDAGPGRVVDVVGAGGGSLALARGDTALWSFANGGTAAEASITTQGHATVQVTAVGANTLDDQLAANSLLPYNIYPFSYPRGSSYYDGHLSTATVDLNGHGNMVTAEAMVNLTVTGGAGCNHVVGGGGMNLFALTGGHEQIEAGTGQTTIVEQAGSLQGDSISGFRSGDLLRFQGFGPDAALSDLGDGHYRVEDGQGHSEAFTLQGIAQLVQGADYVFA